MNTIMLKEIAHQVALETTGQVLMVNSTKPFGFEMITLLNSSGIALLAKGGTGADLSATGGTSQYLKQVSAGAAVTVGTIAAADLPTGTIYNAHVTGIGGTGDAITGTISPARTLAAGDRITFKATAANTGATTIALTGATPATAVAVQKGPGTALAANDIDNGGMYTAVYDGSVWLMPNYGLA